MQREATKEQNQLELLHMLAALSGGRGCVCLSSACACLQSAASERAALLHTLAELGCGLRANPQQRCVCDAMIRSVFRAAALGCTQMAPASYRTVRSVVTQRPLFFGNRLLHPLAAPTITLDVRDMQVFADTQFVAQLQTKLHYLLLHDQQLYEGV